MNGEQTCAMRALPYSAMRSEGEHACVIGPRDEIVAELWEVPDALQMPLASTIAEALNDQDLNHECNAAARRTRAQHVLLLVRENRIADERVIDQLTDLVHEAGVKFARAEIAELTGDGLPF